MFCVRGEWLHYWNGSMDLSTEKAFFATIKTFHSQNASQLFWTTRQTHNRNRDAVG